MRHHIDVERPAPLLLARVEPRATADTGVREVQVDRSEPLLGRIDDPLQIRRRRGIARHSPDPLAVRSGQQLDRRLQAIGVEVRQQNALSAVFQEALGDGGTDAARRSRDDRDFPVDLHELSRSVAGPGTSQAPAP